MTQLFIPEGELTTQATKKIFLDLGHGGTDGGAGSGRYLEKNLVLDLGLKLRSYLQNTFQCQVIMSRTTDKTLSLGARTSHANRVGADFLLSIHYNAFNRSARGYEDFTWNGMSDNNLTGNIRHLIHTEVTNRVLKKYGIPNRGKKKANFHMVRESSMPAVLVETLFCDNPSDQAIINNPNAINDFVVAYGEGIGKGLNLPRKAKPVVAPSPVTAPSTLYKVQVGAFGSLTNARNMEASLKRKGFAAYIYSSNGLHRVQVGAFGSYQNAKNMESRLKASGFPAFIYRD